MIYAIHSIKAVVREDFIKQRGENSADSHRKLTGTIVLDRLPKTYQANEVLVDSEGDVVTSSEEDSTEPTGKNIIQVVADNVKKVSKDSAGEEDDN